MVDPGLSWNSGGGTNEANCRPASVLLVDDRPANLVALEATLAPLGIRTVTAVSGPEALRRLLAEEFALVLLDVQMPGMDGFETATLMKRHPRTAHVPDHLRHRDPPRGRAPVHAATSAARSTT